MIFRRLPIFFVLDVSESMVGETRLRLESGLARVIRQLRTDPYALEAVFVALIVFAGKPMTIRPLTELAAFTPAELPVGGGTALGAALEHLMMELETNVARSTPDRKGDWRPIVFLMTDGHPTDDPAAAIRSWNDGWRGRAHLVAISVGDAADARMLAKFADDVLILESTGDAGFADCVKWISQSVSATSRAVESEHGALVQSAEFGASLKKFDASRPSPAGSRLDERFAVFTGRCQRSRAPYLIKYEMIGNANESEKYRLVGAYPLAESFFALSDAATPTAAMSVADLPDTPACPHCGNACGLSHCSCGKILCTAGPGMQTCPWCEQTDLFEPAVFDVDRGRG